MMKIKMIFIAAAWLVVMPSVSCADEVSDLFAKRGVEFVKNNAIYSGKADAIGLVVLWQQVEGLRDLVQLWKSDKSTAQRAGLKHEMIRRRLQSHRISPKIIYGNNESEMLAAMIKLHADFALDRMHGKVTASQYGDVAAFTISQGQHLAEQVQNKYGDGKIVLKTRKAVKWGQ